MAVFEHLDGVVPCPFLPDIDEPLRAASMKVCGENRGGDFYLLTLKCAQSLWLQGLPAQSLLLINRALAADHESDPAMCEEQELPYAAVAWVMQNRMEGQFIGNPRRHYQHLATRMVEPRKELRAWRAWACWYLACRILPDYPADEEQIEKEGVREPTREEILVYLKQLGLRGEAELWKSVVEKL